MATSSWHRALLLTLIFLLSCQQHSATPSKRIIYRFTDCTAEQLLHLPKLSAVFELSAVTCNITTLPNAYFMRFSALTVLELRESGLATIEDYALSGLDQLQWMSLAGNYITNVKPWAREPLKALNSLDLEGNAIRTLNGESFICYPNLHYLSLAANLLERISSDVFAYVPHLKHLNLAQNRLTVIGSSYFRGMQHLAHLALHHNAIERIEADSFESNAHLRSLRLDGNKLKDLEFLRNRALTRLLNLNLSHNQIETLDVFASSEWAVIDLDVSHNRLEELKGDTLKGLAGVVHLNLSGNALRLLATSCLDKLINLETIDLSANNLTQVPVGLLDAPTQLQRVNLSRNALPDIHATLFAQLPYLRLLDMSHNQLSSGAFIVHFSPLLPRSALTLDLSGNHLTRLDTDAMDALHVCSERVELFGNWWHCEWLIVELVRAPAHFHFGRNYSLAASWSRALLNVSGIDCYDVERKRSIVVLDAGRLWEQRHAVQAAEQTTFLDPAMPTPPPLVWPRVRMDRFDSRSIIIWMLIAIGLAFTGLRILRQLIDRREQAKRLTKLREMKTKELVRLTTNQLTAHSDRS
ncbi:insulin-like growth factor-binding protein complex acid labile subunit isoform X1 [Anastrepha ludens]|uniref:insulin-like growth factor-binding protein complex acid labile subunit isoform X1 n=1 Tax=Anastrepha ludens TaxID=28586 RepID=UPI0023AE9095|nr:insulin-like growth factor-binding protein complex acid labile subunit isoform X1 [Anastrepha ludens]